jgi:hypothetical protein
MSTTFAQVAAWTRGARRTTSSESSVKPFSSEPP